jgi:hypothetical protein
VASATRRLALRVWRLALGVGVGRLALGVGRLALGVRCLVFAVRCLLFGVRRWRWRLGARLVVFIAKRFQDSAQGVNPGFLKASTLGLSPETASR